MQPQRHCLKSAVRIGEHVVDEHIVHLAQLIYSLRAGRKLPGVFQCSQEAVVDVRLVYHHGYRTHDLLRIRAIHFVGGEGAVQPAADKIHRHIRRGSAQNRQVAVLVLRGEFR